MPVNRPPKILILESQMIIAADLSVQFSKLGYHVTGISTRTVDTMKTIENNRPDIIVLNIGGPQKMDGFEIARELIKEHPTAIVFISAHTDRETFIKVIATGPYAFIAKPFKPTDLKRCIETALNRMAAERPQLPDNTAQ